jgi:PAS domain-containing protein
MDESLKAQLQATLDMVPAFTWFAAPSGALLFVNSRGADYLGLPQDHPLVIDIKDRKRVEEALRRSEHYLAEAQSLSYTGSFGWKPDEPEILWSDETYRIFEYDSTVKPTVDSVVQRGAGARQGPLPGVQRKLPETVQGTVGFRVFHNF